MENKENTGLALQGSITPAVINYNFEELEEKLNNKLTEYKGLIVTDSSLKGAKNAKKELASLRIQVEEVRKAVKKKASEAINESDARFKKLTTLIAETEAPLKEAIDAFDERKRKENELLALECIKKEIADLNLRDKFASCLTIKPEYLNLTATKKFIREDIAKEAAFLKEKQDAEDENLKTVQDFVNSQNERISIKMQADIYLSLILAGNPLSDVLNKIQAQADSIYAQEKEAERKRAEEERKRMEELKVVDATFRFGGQTEPVFAPDIAIPDSPAVTPNNVSDIPEILSAAEVPMESIPSADIPEDSAIAIPDFLKQEEKVEIKKEKEYEVNFVISGPFSILREVSEFLKNKKDAGLITMQVLSQKAK